MEKMIEASVVFQRLQRLFLLIELTNLALQYYGQTKTPDQTIDTLKRRHISAGSGSYPPVYTVDTLKRRHISELLKYYYSPILLT